MSSTGSAVLQRTLSLQYSTPRLRYGRNRFDGVLVAIDVQVGLKGRLNNIFVSSHSVIDSVTFLLRMILAKISHVSFIIGGDIFQFLGEKYQGFDL